MSSAKKMLLSAAGNASEPVDVSQVFSTFLYTGNESNNRDIVNNIDLSGEGGLVWTKNRDNGSYGNNIFDTERGAAKMLITNRTSAEADEGNTLTQFNNNGFRINNDNNINKNNEDYVSWTFRKAEKFFDVVTYTGNGSNRTIAHNLGSVPGMIIIKSSSATSSWGVFHRSAGSTHYMYLNSKGDANPNASFWNNTDPTSTVFTVGTQDQINGNGNTYVAYLFAHNDGDGEFGPDADQDIISCGTYTANSTSSTVNIGFEPQWIMVKSTSESNTSWIITDSMRGMSATGSSFLRPNDAEAEAVDVSAFDLNTTGFVVKGGVNGDVYNSNSNAEYIYMAIRFPMITEPEAGTEVFGNITYTGNATDGRVITNDQTNRVDSVVIFDNDRVSPRWFDRIQGTQYLMPKDDSGGVTSTTRLKSWDSQNGVILGNNAQANGNGETHTAFFWTRRKGCYDIVRYTGNFSGRNINHSLGVVPEMMIAKGYSSSQPWLVYHKDMDANNPQNYYAFIGTNAARVDDNGWNDTAPTASVFSVQGNEGNKSNVQFTCWLYATLAGVTKVGTYTGNGGSLTVDCGFASTARYVMVKRILASGSWLVFSSAMGIVAGNEPAHYFDVGTDSGSGIDHIDPESSGFIVNSVGSDSQNPNHNGSKYIFYAVA